MNSLEKKRIDRIYNSINKIAIGGKSNLLLYKNLVDEILRKGDYDYYVQSLLYNYDIDVLSYEGSFDYMKEASWELICFKTLSPIQQKLKILNKKLGIYQIGTSIYSESSDFLNFDWNGPIGLTYSNLDLPSQINFLKNSNNDIVVNLLTDNIFKIDIKRFEWGSLDYNIFGIERQPINKYDIVTFDSGTYSYLTQSNYSQNLLPGKYLVEVESRGEVNSSGTYSKYYYDLNIYSDSYLGTIEEISSLESNPLYYNRNTNLAKILGFNRTFLKVSRVNSNDILIFNEINSKISEDKNLYNRYVKAFDYLTGVVNWLLINLDISNELSYNGSGKIIKNTLGNYNWAFLLNDPIYFNGLNKYVRFENGNWSEIFDNNELDLLENSFSIEIWFRKLDNNYFLFGKLNSWILNIDMYNGAFFVYLNNKPYRIELKDTLYLNRWYQLVVTRNKNTFRVYINGVLKNTISIDNLEKIDSYDGNLVLLNKDGVKTKADISLFRIYNKQLLDSEVLSNFYSLKDRHEISEDNLNTVPSDLLINLDAGLTHSYSTQSSIWMNSTNIINNAVLNGNIIQNENSKYIRCIGDIQDSISIETSNSLNFGTMSFSIEWWFRKLEDSVDWSNLWGPNKWNSVNEQGTNEWALFIGASNSNHYGFMIESGSNLYTINSDIELNITDWNQIVGVKDENEMRLYFNGSFITSSNIDLNMNINSTNSDILISNNTYTDTSNLFIWKKPLTEIEISDNYNLLITRYT